METKNKLFDASRLSDYENENNWDYYQRNPLNYMSLMSETPPVQQSTVIYDPTTPKKYTVIQQSSQQSGQQSVQLNPIIQGAIDLIKQNPALANNVRITSTIRPARYDGDPSNHRFGMAFDAIPINGDFNQLKREIAKDKNLVSYLINNHLGILSEVTPKEQKKYKATKPNLHFGPDSGAIAGLQQILKDYGIESQQA